MGIWCDINLNAIKPRLSQTYLKLNGGLVKNESATSAKDICFDAFLGLFSFNQLPQTILQNICPPDLLSVSMIKKFQL